MIKGNVIIGQSGGPTAVINSSLAGAYSGAKKAGVKKVYGMINGVSGLLKENYVDLDEFLKNDENIKILRQTPSAALGSCRCKLPDMSEATDVYKELFDVLEKLEVAYFIYIGGNDSMDTVEKLSAYAKSIDSHIRFVGVPKTIDNDLPVTDHTPGFGSAAKYIATAVKEIICDSRAYAMKSVSVIEIMGRNAGWLAASAALAGGQDCGGVDMIYLPEYSFDIEECLERVERLLQTKNSVVIAVSEALRDKNGEYIATDGSVHADPDAFGHKIMSGTGQFLARYLGSKLGIKARGIEINTPQRCAAHFMSKQDNDEAFELGCAAVNAAIEGGSGIMPAVIRTGNRPYSYSIEIADISNIANKEKKIPLEWIDRENAYVKQEFIEYCLPLIQGEIIPVMCDGIPVHMQIQKFN